MCIAAPKVGAQNVATPVDQSASDLQLGTAAIINRQAGIYGRLALTGGQRSARNQVAKASLPTATSGAVNTTAPSPGGTVGLPSDYTGQAVYGGLRPKIGV